LGVKPLRELIKGEAVLDTDVTDTGAAEGCQVSATPQSLADVTGQ